MTSFNFELSQYSLRNNLALNTDSYKTTQWMQYPEGMTNLYSYVEARGSDLGFTRVVMFGLQAIIKKFMCSPITKRDVKRANKFVNRHIGPDIFNRSGWDYIVEKHDGRLPLRVRALPEGTVVPLRMVMASVEATDDNCAWLVSLFEDLFLHMWYSCTVATISMEIHQMARPFAERTVDDSNIESWLSFLLNDFGFRGASSAESAEVGGMAHLLSSIGTDNMRAIAALYDFYNLDEDEDDSMPGFSVIASEHTVTCSNSDADKRDDLGALEKMVTILERRGAKATHWSQAIVACVADTYDVFRFAERVGSDPYKDRIANSGGRFVVRPDSGDPTVVPIQVTEILLDKFGYTTNTKGFKVLPEYIRVLQGDGVNQESILKILTTLEEKGISTENIIFGMGGGLLQHCDRDWLKFAMKGSARKMNDGEWYDVYKDPITDSVKRSKKGRVTTFKDSEGKYFTDRIAEDQIAPNRAAVDQMVLVYENGRLLLDEDFGTIKRRMAESLMYFKQAA